MTATAHRERFPPYSAQIAGDVKTVWISAGPHAWDRAKRWQAEGHPGLVLPPGESPADYTWPVRGYHVALIATDISDESVAAIVAELLRHAPGTLAILYGSEPNTQLEIIANGRNG